jgi:riboflavin biosynthesis pyrimidine reductase
MQLKTLIERPGQGAGLLGPELQQLYDGNLSFPEHPRQRPYVMGNFVETLDGVVSYNLAGRSGGQPISGSCTEDLFLMGLLRAVSDAVLIGAGTLRGDPGAVRIPAAIYPEAASLYAMLRDQAGKPSLPLNVILSNSGIIDVSEPTFHTAGLSVAIITTLEGAERLTAVAAEKWGNTTVYSTGESGATTPAAVLRILHDTLGVRLLLHEGGPSVFGQFLRADLIDTLFLTLAPQIAGRSPDAPRPSLAGGDLFLPETAPWLKLRSLKLGTDHLFLRYER